MGRRDAHERVAHLMCELYIRMRNIGLSTENHCEIPLTQIVVADALGLSPVHVSRILRTLRLADIMSLQAGSLTIHNPRRLAEIAGFDDNYLHRRLREFALPVRKGLGDDA